MRISHTLAVTGILAGLSAPAAMAQDWTYRATVYAWLPALSSTVETRFGDIKADQGSSDVISALDMAFMGTFAAQNDRLGLVLDMIYADLSASEPTPFGLAFDQAKVDARIGAVSGYMLYRLTTDSPVTFDAGIGFRNFDLDVNARLTPGTQPGVSQNLSNNFTDALFAARVQAPLNDRWFIDGFADIGAGTDDSSTWQVYAGLGYRIDANWSAEFGWRYMNLAGEADGRDVTLDLNGALVGVSYNF